MRITRIIAFLLISASVVLSACSSPASIQQAPTSISPASQATPTQSASSNTPTTTPKTQTPTQTASAPTTPPAVGFSRGNPLPVEKSLVTPEGIEITVLNLTKGDQAWDIIRKANQFNEQPAQGMQYALITVKLKNISSQKEPWAYSDLLFDLVGISNKIFHTYDKSAVLPKEGILSKLKAELYHDGEATGSLCFYIPQNESDLVLTWRGLTDASRRFFEVKTVATQTPTLTQTTTPNPTPTTTITPEAELRSFLEANFAKLKTSIGDTSFTFYIQHNTSITSPYDYWIQVDYDIAFFNDLQYSTTISSEMNHKVADELRAHQEKLAKALIEKIPNTKFWGGYFKSWYKYPNLKVDLITRQYYSWVNYDPPSILTKYEQAKITSFTWYPLLDDTLLR